MRKTRSIGFTMVELLVVISIISILAAVLYANFGDARIEARNRALMSDMKQVQLALEVYKAQEESYPAAISDLVPDFLAELPTANDSANSQCTFTYQTFSSNSAYKFTALHCYGGDQGVPAGSDLARCPTSCPSTGSCAAGDTFTESLAIYSRGAECQ